MQKMRQAIIIAAIAIIAVMAMIIIVSLPHKSIGISVGDEAPPVSFTLINGTTLNLSQLRGHYILLYFITTWCSGCAAGVETINYYAPLIAAKKILVIVVESYDDLGYQGMPLPQFMQRFGGQPRNWFMAGYADLAATEKYNPDGYPDIYYLISDRGVIIYKNVNLASTFSQALDEIKTIK